MDKTTATTTIKTIDHLVLTCTDVAATVRFYTQHLGMRAEEFTSPKDVAADGQSSKTARRTALRFGHDASHKINLHQRGAEFEPKARTALPGTADLCFELADDDDGTAATATATLEKVRARLRDAGDEVAFDEGGEIVDRVGARGLMKSLYIRDPDGNLIE